jgi:phage terminase Nu1 subunit (DNA packaging protein)
MPLDRINPFRCSKWEVAEIFGVTIKDVSQWVREGCPCSRTGALRSPLEFSIPKVLRWRYVKLAYEHSEMAGKLADKDVEIWDLEYALAVERGEVPATEDFRRVGV